jgi:hypothetical protein
MTNKKIFSESLLFGRVMEEAVVASEVVKKFLEENKIDMIIHGDQIALALVTSTRLYASSFPEERMLLEKVIQKSKERMCLIEALQKGLLSEKVKTLTLGDEL